MDIGLDIRSVTEEPSQLRLPAPSSLSNVHNYQQNYPVPSHSQPLHNNVPVHSHPKSQENPFLPQSTFSKSSSTPFSPAISISSSSCNSSIDTNMASVPIKAVNIKKEL